MTWAAVRTRPWPSITEPLPAAVDCDEPPPPGPNGPKGLPPPPPWSPPEVTPRAVMSTTPAAELASSARGLRPAPVLDPLAAGTGSTMLVALAVVQRDRGGLGSGGGARGRRGRQRHLGAGLLHGGHDAARAHPAVATGAAARGV